MTTTVMEVAFQPPDHVYVKMSVPDMPGRMVSIFGWMELTHFLKLADGVREDSIRYKPFMEFMSTYVDPGSA